MAYDTSGAAYLEFLQTVAASLERLEPAQRLDRLFGLISPLLDEVAEQDEELYDDPEMLTSEAIAGLRRIATGESLDADAIHYHLTYFALVESEDQDIQMHLRSQAAWLASAWLRLKSGHQLRATLDDYGLDTLTDVVNMLAWTRSRQINTHPDDLDKTYSEGDCDLPAALGELRAMLTATTTPSRPPVRTT